MFINNLFCVRMFFFLSKEMSIFKSATCLELVAEWARDPPGSRRHRSTAAPQRPPSPCYPHLPLRVD